MRLREREMPLDPEVERELGGDRPRARRRAGRPRPRGARRAGRWSSAPSGPAERRGRGAARRVGGERLSPAALDRARAGLAEGRGRLRRAASRGHVVWFPPSAPSPCSRSRSGSAISQSGILGGEGGGPSRLLRVPRRRHRRRPDPSRTRLRRRSANTPAQSADPRPCFMKSSG